MTLNIKGQRYYNNNPMYQTDSYKLSHWLQYPPGMTFMQSHLVSRGGLFDKTLFFGLQGILHDLATPFTEADIKEAEEDFAEHGVPFNAEGFRGILKDYGGYFPVHIKAVREGSMVPFKNALLTCSSTDPKYAWVGSHIETKIMRVWAPITVATLSWHCVKVILDALRQSADDPENEIWYKLHDFGARGVSSGESAAILGCAHLVNSKGTDTLEAYRYAKHVYGTRGAGHSIPAAEHSSITSWGREHEVDAYRNMLKQFAKPGSILAVVSDSWDLYNACEKLWGDLLRQEVIDSGATLVIRPDSGEPVEVVVKTLEILANRFGTKTNSKGYKVLNHVRVIQGDGINYHSIKDICNAVMKAGFSLTNVAFGMGGALLQQVNRDTQEFAYKCNGVEVNGEFRRVFKDPATTNGKLNKKSFSGFIDTVAKEDGSYETLTFDKPTTRWDSALEDVYENGKVLREQTLTEIRELAASIR